MLLLPCFCARFAPTLVPLRMEISRISELLSLMAARDCVVESFVVFSATFCFRMCGFCGSAIYTKSSFSNSSASYSSSPPPALLSCLEFLVLAAATARSLCCLLTTAVLTEVGVEFVTCWTWVLARAYDCNYLLTLRLLPSPWMLSG